jgi:hypothetical protein
MHRVGKALVAAALILGTVICASASAHGRGGPRFGFDVMIGPWWWGPPSYYYYDTPAYYPPVVVAPLYSPPSTAQMPPPPAYWYYCAQANAYYPYVSQCPGGWQAVSPTPTPAPSAPAPAH